MAVLQGGPEASRSCLGPQDHRAVPHNRLLAPRYYLAAGNLSCLLFERLPCLLPLLGLPEVGHTMPLPLSCNSVEHFSEAIHVIQLEI